MSSDSRAFAEDTAEKIRPLLPQAKRAYGSQPAGSPSRLASDQINVYLLNYVKHRGNVPALARELEGDISLSGLRRRIRIARALDQALLEGENPPVGRVKRARGSKDPEEVHKAVKIVQEGREQGGRAYGEAVRQVYEDGISLTAVAKELGITYYSLWSAQRTGW